MRPESARASAEEFTGRALLGLELATLAVGACQFAFASATVTRPLVAVTGLVLLTLGLLIVRIPPLFQKHGTRQYWIEIFVLLISVTLLAFASGAAHSAALPLYLVPLTASALAFGRWWMVVLLSGLVVLLGYGLGTVTPGIEVSSESFAALMITQFAPGIAVAIVISVFMQKMHGAVQKITDLASVDALTGLLNVRAFDEVLQMEHRRAERSGRHYSLLVVDVDNLAQINESLGHDAGNQILIAVAAAIDRSIRNSDAAARLGGDEFIVLLTEADAVMGATIGQRIRNNVYSSTVSVANRLIRANVNVGAATFPGDHLYPKELMILADQRMRQDRELRRPPATA
jgi:diguanylate cyclase (GGDEF)-like protein